ncbi:MAG: sugar transferase [Myxacorys chilensis ATA2-1-KO14]|jgi:exopolysaccharide biosynthesis polyprenyl glycosylphosphotransferase|nr:sugar transferase [Myxacorys chilensis ATA2-1-KO14]
MLPTVSRSEAKRDVRSPAFICFQKGLSIRGLRVVLLGSDLVLVAIAWQIAAAVSTPWLPTWDFQENPLAPLLVLCVELGVLVTGDFYKSGASRRNYIGLIKALTIAQVLLLLIAYFYHPGQFISRSHFITFWLLSIVFICANHLVADLSINLLRQKGAIRYPVFLISDGEELEGSTRIILKENRYNIVGSAGIKSLSSSEREKTFAKIQALGVVEAFVSWRAIQDQLFLCWQFQSAGITLHVIPLGLESLFQGSRFWTLGQFPALSFSPPSITSIDFLIKRSLDFLGTVIFLSILFPVYAAIALLIKLDSPGSIFYRQTRIGLHGKPFEVWKFRTMVQNADELQKSLEAQNDVKDGILFKMKRDPRVTRVGDILRRYSLDELPQLFNVALGEMSFVGPRPLPVRDVEKFASHHFVRHEVLPGVTGLWQVSGRSNINNFEDVIQLDLAYIQNWSLWLDLKILLKTVQVVLCRTGAY